MRAGTKPGSSRCQHDGRWNEVADGILLAKTFYIVSRKGADEIWAVAAHIAERTSEGLTRVHIRAERLGLTEETKAGGSQT